VFELIGQGMSTKKIAEQLHLSIKTIETYREKIKEKLNLENAAELTSQAVRWVLEKS
jgi:DNA-binding NarL/FixJ family response regulator